MQHLKSIAGLAVILALMAAAGWPSLREQAPPAPTLKFAKGAQR